VTEGIKATLTGTVTWVDASKFGIDVTEGKRTHKVKAWTKADKPATGDTITASGNVSREDDWTNSEGQIRKGVLALNNVTWTAAQPAPVAHDDWTSSNDEMPW